MAEDKSKIIPCPGGCGCYRDESFPGVYFIGGYINDRIQAGDLPYYAQPDYIEPGMDGLPKLREGYSSEFEPSIVVALRNEAREKKIVKE